MLSRRSFIKFGLGTGSAVLAPWGRVVHEAAAHPHPGIARSAVHALDPLSLYKFADPLPQPRVLAPSGTLLGAPYYEVAMTQFQQKVHADLPPTMLWGYGGSFPGPTFEARAGQRIFVKWINDLHAQRHVLGAAFDPFMEEASTTPQAKTVVHLHGARVPAAFDGNPLAWFSRGFESRGPAWTGDTYEYPNRQDGATLWYHDHAIGQTRLNVYAGLAGMYLLRGEAELAAARGGNAFLPHGAHELVLVIQDRMFDADGSLLYPVRDPSDVPTGSLHPGPWVPEFFGGVVLVNGVAWPHAEVEPARYRLRILNGSNARFYNLALDSGQPLLQIGGDQGFFARPAKRRSILLAPAERADVIVDFSGMRGAVVLRNDARAPFPDGDQADARTVGEIMQFRINRRPAPMRSPPEAPAAAPPAGAHAPAAALVRQARLTRNMALVEFLDEAGAPVASLLNNAYFNAHAPIRPRLGTVEVWNLVNTTGDTHPIHLHLVAFQVVSRQRIDAERYRKDWIGEKPPGSGPEPPAPGRYLAGPLLAPEPGELGQKDTVQAWPGHVTTIVIRFDGYAGAYPWHCHILEHEDNDMMLHFEVVEPRAETAAQ